MRNLVLVALVLVAFPACGGDSKTGAPSVKGEPRLTMGFVTNSSSDFWTYAKAGSEKAAKEFNVDIDFRVVKVASAAEQQQILDDMLTRGVGGIAISPIDPVNQTPLLRKIGAKVKLVCTDSDAPDSGRLAYVGTDNVEAGRKAGNELKKALPDGGKVILFVGALEPLNASQRRHGILEALKDSKVTVVDTRTDQTDREKARTNVDDALVAWPDLKACVGLWSYNAPAILAAVKSQKKVGKVKIIAFDEEEDTLRGVEEGSIAATIVQQPYRFGYESIRLLATIAKGAGAAAPKGGIVDVPAIVVTQSDVAAFRKSLADLRR